jgi:glucose/mannose-6-phosphate isomerase
VVAMTEYNLNEMAEKLDSDGMLDSLRCFVDDLIRAFTQFDFEVPKWIDKVGSKEWDGILCLGMGGSGAGGCFLETLFNSEGNIPIVTWRNYGIPSWWNKKWLVLATSYSGNTEETLDGISKIIEANGTIITISSGGILAGLSEMNEQAYHIHVPGGRCPRAAFGHLFGTQIALVWKLFLLERPNKIKLEELLSRLADEIENSDFIANSNSPIIELANALVNTPIAIISSAEMEAAAERFSKQINENAGRYSRHAIIPEMNHNEIVAWGMTGEIQDESTNSQSVIILDSPHIHPRTESRMKWFTHYVNLESAWKVSAEGESLLECLLHLCILMDWTSCALALLHNKNPSTTPSIDSLKRHLSDQ